MNIPCGNFFNVISKSCDTGLNKLKFNIYLNNTIQKNIYLNKSYLVPNLGYRISLNKHLKSCRLATPHSKCDKTKPKCSNINRCTIIRISNPKLYILKPKNSGVHKEGKILPEVFWLSFSSTILQLTSGHLSHPLCCIIEITTANLF